MFTRSKKPANLQFLDFTGLEKRRLGCLAELELNQRLSSNSYLEVLPITVSDQGYKFKGSGKIVEYAVKMVQLDDQKRLDRCLLRGRIDPAIIPKLAQMLTRFYQCAPSTPKISAAGTWDIVWKNCEENFEQSEELNGKRILEGDLLQIVRAVTRSFLSQRKYLFEQRVINGKIKDYHGDLKTEHIYPVEILRKRLKKRETQADVSDAREYHLKAFIKKFEPMDEIDSQIYIEVDTEAPVEENIKKNLNLKQFNQMILVRRIKNTLF